jgi:hypothetical protein
MVDVLHGVSVKTLTYGQRADEMPGGGAMNPMHGETAHEVC